MMFVSWWELLSAQELEVYHATPFALLRRLAGGTWVEVIRTLLGWGNLTLGKLCTRLSRWNLLVMMI